MKGVAATFVDFLTGLQSLLASGQCPPAAGVQPFVVNHPQMGRTAIVTFIWSSSDHSAGKDFLEKLLRLGPVAMQNVAETNVTDWLKTVEAFCPNGIFGGDRGISFRKLTPQIFATISHHLDNMPSNPATSFIVHLLSRTSPSATDPKLLRSSCFNPEARQEHFLLELLGSTLEESSSPQSQKWTKDMYTELKGSGDAMDGSYVALAHPEDACLEKTYGAAWKDLLDLKRRLDPKGIFRNAVPRM